MVIDWAGLALSSSSVTLDAVVGTSLPVGCCRRDEQRRANLFLRSVAKSCGEGNMKKSEVNTSLVEDSGGWMIE